MRKAEKSSRQNAQHLQRYKSLMQPKSCKWLKCTFGHAGWWVLEQEIRLERLGGCQITEGLGYHDKWFQLLGDSEGYETGGT